MPKNHTSQHHKKHFDEWNKVKKGVQKRARVPFIQEGEIWWFADGQNIGVEIDGKGHDFARPVLVLTKFGKLSFMGIPLTTKEHEGTWYAPYSFKGQKCWAALCQAKMCSVYRLYRKMGALPEPDVEMIREAFVGLHIKKFPLSSDRGGAGNPEDVSIISHLLRKIKAFFKHFRHGKPKSRPAKQTAKKTNSK